MKPLCGTRANKERWSRLSRVRDTPVDIEQEHSWLSLAFVYISDMLIQMRFNPEREFAYGANVSVGG